MLVCWQAGGGQMPGQDRGAKQHRWRIAFGEQLRRFRHEGGLTQEQLAELANVHPGFIQKLEAGERLPSLPTLLDLAQALSVPLEALLPNVPPRATRSDVTAVAALLANCSPQQVALTRAFVLMLQREGFCR